MKKSMASSRRHDVFFGRTIIARSIEYGLPVSEWLCHNSCLCSSIFRYYVRGFYCVCDVTTPLFMVAIDFVVCVTSEFGM